TAAGARKNDRNPNRRESHFAPRRHKSRRRAEPGARPDSASPGAISEIIARRDVRAKDVPRLVHARWLNRQAPDLDRPLRDSRRNAGRDLVALGSDEEPHGRIEGELRNPDETEVNFGTCASADLEQESAQLRVADWRGARVGSATKTYIELRCNQKAVVVRAS